MNLLCSKQVFAAFAGRYARELSDQLTDDDDDEATALPRQLFEGVRNNALT